MIESLPQMVFGPVMLAVGFATTWIVIWALAEVPALLVALNLTVLNPTEFITILGFCWVDALGKLPKKSHANEVGLLVAAPVN